MSKLEPVRAAPPWAVSGRKSFADNTFQALLQGRCLQRDPVVIGRWQLSVRAAEANPLQGGAPLGQRTGGEVHAIKAQQVEDHEGDRPGDRQASGLSHVADVHAFGESGERGNPGVQRDDLAVQEHVVGHAGGGQGAQLGEARGDVVLVAGEQPDLAIGDVGQHPHPVPLDLVCPLLTAGDRGSRTSQHGAHGSILTQVNTQRAPGE